MGLSTAPAIAPGLFFIALTLSFSKSKISLFTYTYTIIKETKKAFWLFARSGNRYGRVAGYNFPPCIRQHLWKR